MPERRAVCDGVGERDCDEYAVGQFGDLHGEEWVRVAVVVEEAVEGEEGVDEGRDEVIIRGEDVRDGDVGSGGVDEGGAVVGAIEGDGDGGAGVGGGGEAAD